MAPPTSWRGSLSPAGYPDRPMVIRYRALAGTMTYRSFHAAATRTFSEGERRLRRARYKEPLEGIFLGSGTGQKCVSSPVADEVARPPANGRKAEAPRLSNQDNIISIVILDLIDKEIEENFLSLLHLSSDTFEIIFNISKVLLSRVPPFFGLLRFLEFCGRHFIAKRYLPVSNLPSRYI